MLHTDSSAKFMCWYIKFLKRHTYLNLQLYMSNEFLKKIIALMVVLTSCPDANIYAQEISSSPYSAYGIGVLKNRTSALNRSLASTGIGIRDSYNLNNTNPASYAFIEGPTMLVEMGFFYETDNLKTKDLTQRYNSGNLSSLNLWFRGSKRWAATVGLSPYSTVNYSIKKNEKLIDGGDSEVKYNGSGGLSQLYFGNAFKFTKNLSLGITGSYIFGSLKKNETITVETSRTTLEKTIYAHRLNFDAGLQYTFLLKDDKSLTLGAVYEDDLKPKTYSKKLFYKHSENDTIQFDEQDIDDYRLPAKIGGGASFQTKKFLFAGDVIYRPWLKGKVEEGVSLQNTIRVSAGIEYKGDLLSDRYLKMIRIRSGFYVQNNYLIIDNSRFNEWGLTFGLGLPLDYGKGTLGITYNYNKSGTTDNNLIEQRASVITLDITFRDLWGIKRRID